MNGAHDLGGMHGFGPVAPEADEPVFHTPWERRAFALTLAMGFTGQWNLDQSRHARETMAPAAYLATSYYEHWLFGLEALLAARGLLEGASSGLRRLDADNVAQALSTGGPTARETASTPAFAPGDNVRARTIHPTGHTRLPRYCRGRVGRVERLRGAHVFPDSHAATGDPEPCHLYSVRFAARELWGPSAPTSDTVMIDLWEPYLERA
ncbi:MAG: nitrile hydratase subunit beta [Alphaproteobacteria bacterium]|nr:nitrile hydratase subunit beta [Alphaproteobacteria bacterium]MCY4317756.1 nitrile hydratase subunit beta [Alphaproteobacteria bacterium]